MTGVYSFTNYSGIAGTPINFIGFQNYVEAFTSGIFSMLPAIKVTLIFAVSVTIIQNALGLLLAIVFNNKVHGVVFYRAVVFLPLVLSVTVTGMLWSLIFAPEGGIAEPIWKAIFGHASSFFGSYSLALPMVIAVQIWQSAGFTMMIYLAGLQAIPNDLNEASALDGANRWQRFWGVTFPMVAPSITVNVLLCIIGSLGSYDLIYVLTNGQFGTQTLSMYMFSTAFQGSNELGYASMIQMLQFVLVLIVTVIMQWYLRRREVQL
jgi:raffinose/stachyose/melibiose transport system permease protein